MKLTIDLHQSPIALRKELDDAVRFALGATFYIEEADGEPAFTQAELANPAVNVPNGLPALPLPGVASASVPLTPTTSGATVAPAASGVELDSAGLPYDVRIHSAGKSKIADGTWKLKKGVDKGLVAQVNAQNKQLLGQALPATAPITITAVVQGPSTISELPTLPAGAAALPTLPPVVAVPDATAEIVVTDYPSFAQFVAQQVVKHGQKATDELNRGLTHYGLVDPTTQTPQLPLMAHRPDIVDPFYKWFKTTLGA